MKRRLSLTLVVVLLLLSTACSKPLVDQLPGSWNNGLHVLTLYSDGVYEETMRYGSGSWVLLEDSVLELTDYYGNVSTYPISEISRDTLTLTSGVVWTRIY